MICYTCGRKIPDGALSCRVCKPCYAEESISRRLAEAAMAMRGKDFALATSIYHALADEGVAEAACAYGDILENGILLIRDLELAMKYFHAATVKGSPLGAYRYGRLVSRANIRVGDFWTAYSALLGCAAAYRPAAELYESLGDEQTAAYYCSLDAVDDSESTVDMAKRYVDGSGVEKNDRYAKWHLDSLGMPPVYALKLCYKLRGVQAEEPKPLPFSRKIPILRSLLTDAERYKLNTAVLKLSELLAAEGDGDDVYRYAMRLLSLTDKDSTTVGEALRLLSEAANAGSASAARTLGDIYLAGDLTEKNHDAALECYRLAAQLGEGSSYEILGDIYCDGQIVGADYATALGYYLDGAKEGHIECRRKAEEILRAREDYFRRAEASTDDDAEAFRCYAISAAMGYLDAYSRLAERLEHGIGIGKDRRAAFLWYEYALSEGDESARYHVGRCYAYGIGVRFSFKKAVEVLSAAKRAGSAEADAELYRIYQNKYNSMLRSLYSSAMRLFYQKKLTEARERLEVCRDMGHPAAIYTLGCMHELGLGMPTDRRRAEELYREAAMLGFRDAKMSYKHRVLKMGR